MKDTHWTHPLLSPLLGYHPHAFSRRAYRRGPLGTAPPDQLHRSSAGWRRRTSIAKEAVTWIIENLGEGDCWPGNVRELEQCIRNVLIRRDYTPPRPKIADQDAVDRLTSDLREGQMTADELLQW